MKQIGSRCKKSAVDKHQNINIVRKITKGKGRENKCFRSSFEFSTTATHLPFSHTPIRLELCAPTQNIQRSSSFLLRGPHDSSLNANFLPWATQDSRPQKKNKHQSPCSDFMQSHSLEPASGKRRQLRSGIYKNRAAKAPRPATARPALAWLAAPVNSGG